MKVRELPSRVKAGASRSAKAGLRGLGLELRRLPEQTDAASYYRPPPSCQIPNLGFLYELFLGKRSDGLFVEVGAYDGFTFSNTSCLAQAGWRGLFIEPVPEFAQRCRARYADNDLIEVIECAVGLSDTPIGLFVGGPLTTANHDLASEYLNVPWSRKSAFNMHRIEVPQARLDDLLSERHIAPGFDLLVVDVEGFETEVFGGFSIDRWRPKMLIIELADTHPDLATTRRSDAALARSITNAGYDIAFKDSINTMFVRRD